MPANLDTSTPINKAEQMKALRGGMGMQHILNMGYRILGNPIYVYCVDYTFLGCTGNIVTDDPLWNELVTTGIYREETIQFMKTEYFIDAAANAKTVALLASDSLKYNRILGKIINRDNIIIAYANIVACQQPFEIDDPVIFEGLCKKLSKEVSKDEFYQTYGEMHQEAVINELIDGRTIDKKLYTCRVADIYNRLKNYLYLAVADFSKFDSENAQLAYYKSMFKQIQPLYKYAVYKNYIVFFMSTNSTSFQAKRALRKFREILEQENIRIGISGGFENLFELSTYFAQAIHALHSGMTMNSEQRIFCYDEISHNVPQ